MSERSACESVVRQLWPYLDGAVPDDRREIVAEHLAICQACASHFDFARAFLDAVAASHGTGPIDPALRARVMHALAAEGFSLPL